ncbi:MAG: hypothetical protein K9M96_14850 [Deltaproteobacteria bacterium]|nr:hypothetical protein [Deltaproteobacteria bacterium]
MGKKKRDPVLDEYEKLEYEMVRDKVDEIFRNHPEDYISELEKIGFQYVDDEGDYEEMEEQEAKPENPRQRDLVAFFEDRKELSEEVFERFTEEKVSENPNYPLIRKYFKRANRPLKALLLYGLENYPGRIDILSDMAYFHEFENVLHILIAHYTRACVEQQDLNTFSKLARDFYYATSPDGYEAYYALKELFEPESDKAKIIDFLIAEEAGEERDAAIQ